MPFPVVCMGPRQAAWTPARVLRCPAAGSRDGIRRDFASLACWFSLRLRPYRTLDDRIEGAVLALVDIDSIKSTEQSLRASEVRLRIM